MSLRETEAYVPIKYSFYSNERRRGRAKKLSGIGELTFVKHHTKNMRNGGQH